MFKRNTHFQDRHTHFHGTFAFFYVFLTNLTAVDMHVVCMNVLLAFDVQRL